MKVGQVTSRYPPHTGGVETHVQELAEGLTERGHEVTVVTADMRDGLSQRGRRNGVDIVRHRGFAPDGAFHVAPGIVHTVRSLDADIVHAHNYHSLPLLFAALGVGERRFVATPHYHGASADAFRNRLLNAYRPLGRWALHKADIVVAVSEWERNRIREDFGIDPTVIPNGLDVTRFRTAEPEGRNRPYLLCVGRLEAYKGIQHAIRALAELPEFDLLIAGNGPFREELEQIARKAGVADRVEFLGYVDETCLPGLYVGADVYLALSSFEAYGLTVSEALAAGTPCVVRERGALAEWITAEQVVGVNSVAKEAVTEGVEEAIDVTASDTSVPSWDTVVNRLLEVYQSNI